MSVQRLIVAAMNLTYEQDRGPVQAHERVVVTYADHVAALAEAEQRHPDIPRCQEDLDYVRAEALREAREAVAGGFTTLTNDPFISPSARNAVNHYLTGAIEEIDALGGQP